MPFLQEWIHKLEEGPWIRYVKLALALLVLLVFVAGYNWRAYRNISSQDGMDAVQVARNVSEGKGFTTLFIRPLSIHLVKQKNTARPETMDAKSADDPARIKGLHPDLANPPVYPLVLAGWMKVYSAAMIAAEGVREVMPKFVTRRVPNFDYELDNRFWASSGRFWWHPHDFLIAMFNQLLLFAAAWLTFLLARRLFDAGVAWLSALVLVGCEPLWRFSTSGLSTMLLLVIFLSLVWCLVLLEAEVREPREGTRRVWLLAGSVGLLLGLGVLTRYAFGWLLIPVLVYVGLVAGQRRLALCGIIAGLFLLMLMPWVVRNYTVSGMPFGTASFALIDYGSDRLARSLEPNFGMNFARGTIHKFLSNSRGVLVDDIPKLGGGWLVPFFLVGLMLGMRSPAIRRLRYFLLMSLVTLVVVQALGKTQLWVDSPEINSENLLVLLVPLILVYGVSLFFILLDQLTLPSPKFRFAVMGLFGAIVCLPMFFVFVSTRTTAVAYPPYFPPIIQESGGWMNENELMMSDIPWAVAWYGKRQCVWLTRNASDDFYALNDFIKPVRALYLTQATIDQKLQSQMIAAGKNGWGAFALEMLLSRQISTAFPLRKASPIFPSGQLFLTDRQRWDLDTGGTAQPRLTPDEPEADVTTQTNAPAQLQQ